MQGSTGMGRARERCPWISPWNNFLLIDWFAKKNKYDAHLPGERGGWYWSLKENLDFFVSHEKHFPQIPPCLSLVGAATGGGLGVLLGGWKSSVWTITIHIPDYSNLWKRGGLSRLGWWVGRQGWGGRRWGAGGRGGGHRVICVILKVESESECRK